MSKDHRASFVRSSLVALACLGAGCSSGSEEEAVRPKLEIVNQTASALSAASITAVTGTYSGTCSGRDPLETEGWVVDLVTPASSSLTVRKNDPDCRLTVRNILTADSTFSGTPAITLDTVDAYKSTSSAFAIGAGPLGFYGNAKISALTYLEDFTITLLVSDDAQATAPGTPPAAGFATEAGSVSASAVPAPAYTVGFGGMTVTKDAENVVQSAAGFAQLTVGAVAGEDYAVSLDDLTGATFAAVDAAYAAAASKGTLASLAVAGRIPAASFGLEAADLDTATYRTIILRHTVSDVSSYQYFVVLFE
ncbi:MAG: hypothetical protein JWP97_6093 [Labilithrix sp.]|nr:hypothetical protein [Labilithrix sp.]